MKRQLPIFLFFFFSFTFVFSANEGLSDYNIAWKTPSTGSHESMPCGGGSIGMNVWVEQGDLYFYFSESGTFDENNAFLKGGRVRLRLDPNPFISDVFHQELHLNDGYVEVSAGEGNQKVTVELWADVFRPTIHLEVKSNQPIHAGVSYESWRHEDFLLREGESHSNSYKFAPPAGLKIKKDSISFKDNSILFFHHNGKETVFDETVKRQKLDGVKDQMMNPLAYLTFGGKLYGDNLIPGDTYTGMYQGTPFKGWTMKSHSASSSHHICLSLHNQQTESLSAWEDGLNNRIKETKKQEKTAKEVTRNWWHAFWERSFIRINPGTKDSEAWKMGRNYQLFRYMLGCNAYGSEPTKFNGGLFTFDPAFVDPARAFTPDFRLWGGGTMTAQNQRLIYFPMLKSGDFDMMASQFHFYERMLKNAELRTQVYWGHAGASFTEQIENFGLPNISEDAWQPRREGADPGVESNPWLEYTWDTALEFALMMLDANAYNQEPILPHLPFIESVLTFFDEHYRYRALQRGTQELDGDGKLILYPGSGCETYKMATNATSTIVALQVILERLLALPELSAEKQAHWKNMLNRIPIITFRECNGYKTISPAKAWKRINNEEVPQLYPVYPWRTYGLQRPDLNIARNTYWHDPEAIKFRSHTGWKQDNIFAACLGLTEEAKRLTGLKLGDGPHRFPAFWGPGFDWTPDHNWGGSGMIGLQEMLLQTKDEQILLFPAWPEEWDVHFRLHAPGETVVEVSLKDGRIQQLSVTPQSREKDILICNTAIQINSPEIRVNQLGYLPTATKTALIKNAQQAVFSVIDNKTHKVVYTGNIGSTQQWELSGELLSQADFSSVKKEGEYYIKSGNVTSPVFRIKKDVFREVADAVMKSYYYQRVSCDLEEKYAGVWARPAGHPDRECLYHPSTGKKEGTLSSPGGWYDAGDYGKYVVNAGITVGTLLSLAEQFPEVYPDGSLYIPESGNGKSDLLDEVKIELDWLTTMQDSDGGVFFKLTTKNFCGFVMPHEDFLPRYVIGKTTSSALDFVAVMAMAGRIYKGYDPVFAFQCLSNAERAWTWARQSQETYFANPEDIFTGGYEDSHLADEHIWAAVELYLSTGKDIYQDFIKANAGSLQITGAGRESIHIPSWANVSPLAVFDLALCASDRPDSLQQECREYVIRCADKIIKQIEEHPSRMPQVGFHWGSNSEVANHGLYLINAYKLTKDRKYIQGIHELADYLLGRNSTGYSFITGYGTKTPMYPHHRPSDADTVAAPVPGFVVGGPNGFLNDTIQGADYIHTRPPMAYVDMLESYASNEVAINWNAPVVALFAILNQESRR